MSSIPKLLARLGRLQETIERERAASSMAALYGLTKEDAMKQYGKITGGGVKANENRFEGLIRNFV